MIMVKNILSIVPYSYKAYIDLSYEHIIEVGIEYVELPIPLEEIHRKSILKLLEDVGLKISSLYLPFNVRNKKIKDDFTNACLLATEMDVKIFIASVNSKKQIFSKIYSLMKGIGDIAKDHGLILCMEGHPDLITNGNVGRETMKNIDHPNIRVNWDTGNIYYYNEQIDGKPTDCIKEMKKIAPWLGSVHLKDTNGKPNEWHFPALGEGIVDFKKVFEVANKAGIYGPFTMELEGIYGEKLDFEGYKKRVEDSFAYLKSLGVLD